MRYEAEVVNQAVDAPAPAVYDFAVQMENLPRWASGLSSGISQRDGCWFAQSPMGEVEVKMAARNSFGVLDHQVTLPDGSSVHNALRVTPAGSGSVLSFVVLRLPGTKDDVFAADVAHVRKALKALAQLMARSG